jgi:ribosomal protein S3
MAKRSEQDIPLLRAIAKLMPVELIKDVEVSREGDMITVLLHTPDPGGLIGEKGENMRNLHKALKELTGQNIIINIWDLSTL